MKIPTHPDKSIHEWIDEERIKNEKGDLITFKDHTYLTDIYADEASNIDVMKPAQVGMSTCQILRDWHAARNMKMDIIYTLPTDSDVRTFVGGKVNRIIVNNPCMLKDVADKDSIEQKKVGNSMVYFRGTWTKKAAIMVTADRLSHDEIDSSKLDVVADYQARLQHSKFKQTHTFSHPSLPEVGVHKNFLKSDQKHWFVKCEHCAKWQTLTWDSEDLNKMSIDLKTGQYRCKKCGKQLSDSTRARGQWVQKYKDRERSGYSISLLMASWISAKDIIEKWKDPDMTPEFFNTKILGLPYADGSAKLLREHFMQNLTGKLWAPDKDERIVVGIDTGLNLDYVMGNRKGLFFHGTSVDYGDLNNIMERWVNAVAVIDAGGDLIGCRKFAERWPGRVYICYLTGDRKTNELVKWGKKEEQGSCTADRNRMIQLVIDEYRERRLRVHGTENDWFEYWVDWNNLSKIKILDPDTNVTKGYKWVRSGRDHKALATVFWRVGMMKFAGMGKIVEPKEDRKADSYFVNPDQTADFNPEDFFDRKEEEEDDWRLR